MNPEPPNLIPGQQVQTKSPEDIREKPPSQSVAEGNADEQKDPSVRETPVGQGLKDSRDIGGKLAGLAKPDTVPDFADESARYWASMQRFALVARERLHEVLTPDELEQKISADWKAVELGNAAQRDAFMKAMSESEHARQKILQQQRQVAEKYMTMPSADFDTHSFQDTPKNPEATKAPSLAQTRTPTTLPKPELPQHDKIRTAPVPTACDDDDEHDPPCHICNDKYSHRSVYNDMNMIICDSCCKGYHRKCIGMTHPHPKSLTWYCNDCVSPGLQVDRFWKMDNKWHRGVVKWKQSGQFLIQYKDGEEEEVDLNKVRWRVVLEENLANFVAQMNIAPPKTEAAASGLKGVSEAQNDVCPNTYGDLRKMPNELRDRWFKANDKEFEALISKGALRIVDEKHIPRDAIFVPSKYAFRIKACGTLKSRLCILGNLMPKDDMDVSSPTPRLSSFRLLLAHAIRNDLEVDGFDVVNAFVSANSKGAMYIRLPPGRDQPGKAALLLKNLYGSSFAPALFSNLLHNWLTANGFISSPQDPCLYRQIARA